MKLYRHCILFSLLLCIIISSASAQINKASFNQFTVELRKPFYKKSVTGKHYFQFAEERNDTTRMGYFFSDNKVFYFVFPEAAVNYLRSKYNDDDNVAASDTILISLRRLWISQEKISSSLAKSILLTSVSTVGSCRVMADLYKKTQSGYLLMESYDSTITKKGYLGNTNDELMGKSILHLMKYTDSIGSLNKVAAGAQPKNRIATNTILPKIITDEKMNDGIYLSYADFLNNTPVAIDFEFRDSWKGQVLRLKENRSDDSVYTAKSWGLCKDGVAYVRLDNSFSQLKKYQHSFDLFITAPVTVKYKKLASAIWTGVSIATTLSGPVPELAVLDIPSKKVSNAIVWTGVYKLDLATGEIY